MTNTECAGLILSLIAVSECRLVSYVVGGKFASINQHPHSAFLNIHCTLKDNTEGDWVCGSSIVNQRIFLTAGHCLALCTAASDITITMGSEHVGKGFGTKAYSFVVHENFNLLTNTQDIAMVRSMVNLKLNAKISRVALTRKLPYYEKGHIAGWGSIDDSKILSNHLKYVEQTVWKDNECVKLLGRLHPGTFCASSKKSSEYAARGDSGSALVVRGYIQIGLVSYKIPTRAKHVVVYTDVGYHYDWIMRGVELIICE